MTKPIIRKNTKLEEEMYQALKDAKLKHIAAAEVAKIYIEKAFDAGMAFIHDQMINSVVKGEPNYIQFLEQNGIIDPPGLVVSNGMTSTE